MKIRSILSILLIAPSVSAILYSCSGSSSAPIGNPSVPPPGQSYTPPAQPYGKPLGVPNFVDDTMFVHLPGETMDTVYAKVLTDGRLSLYHQRTRDSFYVSAEEAISGAGIKPDAEAYMVSVRDIKGSVVFRGMALPIRHKEGEEWVTKTCQRITISPGGKEPFNGQRIGIFSIKCL